MGRAGHTGAFAPPRHCEDGLNRVACDTRSGEQRLGWHHCSPHYHMVGLQGWDSRATGDRDPIPQTLTAPHLLTADPQEWH